ncbi:MAG: flagellar export chaperone FliS [Gammaproteobacteria bacterium]
MANIGKFLSAIGKYKKVDVQSAVLGASPHRLVELLFDGAISRVVEAKAHMERKDLAKKAVSITSCLDIVNGLRGSLNMEQGGEIAVNLDLLYDYIARRLISANCNNDVEILKEVHGLLSELRASWSSITPVEDATSSVRAATTA